MNKLTPLILSILVIAVVGCSTTAQKEYYRPKDSVGERYRIGGKLEPCIVGAGELSITINDEPIIQERLPAFANTAEVSGEYEGKPVLVSLTRVHNFGSRYVRADVSIGDERAASLAF